MCGRQLIQLSDKVQIREGTLAVRYTITFNIVSSYLFLKRFFLESHSTNRYVCGETKILEIESKWLP